MDSGTTTMNDNTSDQHSRKNNTLVGLIAIALWSTSVAIIRSTSEQIGPFLAAACVYIIAGILLIAYDYFISHKALNLSGARTHHIVIAGFLFALYVLCLYTSISLALDRTQVLEIALVNYLWPTLTLALSTIIQKNRSSWVLVIGVLLATYGVFLSINHQVSDAWFVNLDNFYTNPAPYGIALLGAASWALYSNLNRKWFNNIINSGVAIFMIASGVLLFALSFVSEHAVSWSTILAVEILYLSISIALAYAFWDLGTRKGSLVVIASASYVIPFFSTLVSSVYLDVIAGPRLWISCALITIGAFICRYAIREEGPRAPYNVE